MNMSGRAVVLRVMWACLLFTLALARADEAPYTRVDGREVIGVRYSPSSRDLSVLFANGTTKTHSRVDASVYKDFLTCLNKDFYYQSVVATMRPVVTGRASASTVVASEGMDQPEPYASLMERQFKAAKPRVHVEADCWYSLGMDKWRTTFDDVDAKLGPYSGVSDLRWEHVDSPMGVVSAEASLGRWIYLSGRVGLGTADDVSTRDTDLLTVPADRVVDFKLSESRAISKADLDFYMIDVHARASEWAPLQSRQADFDVFLGYQHATEDMRIRRGLQTVVDDVGVSRLFENELNSTFEFTWSGLRVGSGGSYYISKCLTLEGRIAAIFDVDYEGEGFWNLRDDLRAADPSFIQKASHGSGLDAELGLAYRWLPHIGFRCGYRWMRWESGSGRSVSFLADGKQSATTLESASSNRQGAFLGAFAEF